MNKRLIVGLLIAIILIIGGVVAANKFGKNETDIVNTPEPIAQAPQQQSETSLTALLQSGQSQTCTFSTSGMYASEGKVYITKSKYRGDFTSIIDSKPSVSHILVDGNTSYIWTDGQQTGIKTEFDADAVADSVQESGLESGSSFDANANLNYNCLPWVADESMFTLPAGVNFTNLNTQLSAQCAACDSLSGDAKTQCKTALKCE